MKKFLVIFGLLAFILAGCNFPGQRTAPPAKPKAGAEQAGEGTPTEQKEKEKKEAYIGFQTPVKGVREFAERYQTYEGIFQQKMDGYRVILLAMGEKMTGGYQVEIKKLKKLPDKWEVVVAFKEPAPGEMTTQVVNSPFEIVSIIDDGKPVEISRYTGHASPPEPVEVIEIPEGKKLAASKNFILFTPLEGEQVLNPVTIRGKARVFEANFRVHLEDGHNYLAEKVIMANQGAPEWGSFQVDLPFDKPTNPQGFLIFSYENMENGKLIEELAVPVKF